jgi:CelD/BcsL family acetyltransferase involved in cellulose biosynthesis
MVSRNGAVYRVDPETSALSSARHFFGAEVLTQSLELHCKILTATAEVEKISAEWQALHERANGGIFGNYDVFEIWWKNIRQEENIGLHVAIARNASGELRALLPLVVRRRGFVRILEWAGQEVFDCCDVLAEKEKEAQALWQFVRSNGHYDVAVIKDVRDDTLSGPLLASAMRLRKQHKNYFVTLGFPSGAAWLAAQPRKLRTESKRKIKKMEEFGPIVSHVYRKGEPVPDAVIDALYEQKKAWVESHNHSGIFLHPKMKFFLRNLAQSAAQKETLYLAWLSCGDKIIACHIGFICNEILYLYISTYEATFAYYSPGTLLMIETIKTAVDAKLREVDFMRGDEGYKNHFAGSHRVLSDYIAGGSWVGKILALLR